MSQQNLNKVYGHVKVVNQLSTEITTGARQLDKFDSGKTFFVSQSVGAFTITLPSDPVRGWNATFILMGTAANAVSIDGADTGQLTSSVIVSDDGTTNGIVMDGTDGVDFIASVAAVGDKIEILCISDASDGGIGYHVTGFCST